MKVFDKNILKVKRDVPILTKKMVEDALGYEIKSFKVEPVMYNGKLSGYSVNLEPVIEIKHINVEFTLLKNSDNF